MEEVTALMSNCLHFAELLEKQILMADWGMQGKSHSPCQEWQGFPEPLICYWGLLESWGTVLQIAK